MDTLSNLLRQSSLDDHKQILKAADHTLKTDASNIEAQHAKVVALLKLDRYDDALQAFEDAGETLKDTARLEWAYTLYRTNRSEEAEQVAKSDNTKRSLKHVSAQVAYRAENFALAGKIYDVLTRQGAGHESSDLRINSSANDAQLAWTGQAHLARKTKRDREDMEHSETAFNVACGCISRGELKQAEMLLNMARDLCNADDELDEEDRQAELLPIVAQQLYVAIAMGKEAEAEQVAKSLTAKSLYVTAKSDPTMQRIAWFNYLLATCHDPRVVRTRMWDWKDCQPFTYQGAAMYHNDLALDFEREKYHAVRSSTEKVLSNNDGDRISGKTIVAGYFHAASRGHRELSDGDKHSIKPLLSTAPFLLKDRPLDVGLVLVIVQFYIMMDNTAAAVDALESLLSGLEASSTPGDAAARFSPGLIAILVTLYDRQGRSSDIKSELTKVATYHRSNNSVAGMPPSLLTAMGIALLDKDESSNESSNESNNESSDESSDLELAHDLFTTYHSSHPDSVIAIAGLAATAKSATSVSAKLLSKLPSIAELTAGIDAAALEAAGVAVMPDHLSPSTPGKRPGTPNPSKRPAPASATKTPPSGKHKKGRLSKDYDEMKTPDSERWTPVRDRTNFRPKGKKKAGGRSLGGALQGSPSGYQAGDEGPGTPAQGAGTVLAGKGRKGRKR